MRCRVATPSRRDTDVDKLKQWALLTVIAVLAVFAAGWFLLISPKRTEAAGLHATAASYDARSATLRGELAMLEAQARDLPKQEARLKEIGRKIPASPDLPTFIRTLTDAAKSAGVELDSLAPARPVAGSGATVAAPGTPDAATGAAVTGTELSNVPVSLQVSGSYFQLEEFLHNLEELPRAFLVTQFSVAAETGAVTQGGSANLTASIGGR